MAALTIEQAQKELDYTERQIRPLQNRARQLEGEIRRLESIAYIKANSITRHDVQMSSGDDMPYFDNVWEFAEWLRFNSTKRFCEWNNKIHFRSDLINGTLTTESKGWITELD